MDDDKLARSREDGFTLIELMVVVLIIGILIGIALPTMLGARKRAEDRAAQTDLRSGLIAANSFYTVGGTYTGFDTNAAQAAEPALQWAGVGAPTQGQLAIQVASSTDLLLIALSKSGTYWCLGQIASSPVTERGGDPVFTNVDTVPECTQGW